MEQEKVFNKICVYSDVVDAGLIQPFKKLYTMADFKRLYKEYHDAILCRFILICSAIYYEGQTRQMIISDCSTAVWKIDETYDIT